MLLAMDGMRRYCSVMNLGGRLMQARERRGLTQSQLAALVDTDQANISALETRDSRTSELLFELADALKINPRWLQTGEGESGLDHDAWEPIGALLDSERELIGMYRALSGDARRALMAVFSELSEQQRKRGLSGM